MGKQQIFQIVTFSRVHNLEYHHQNIQRHTKGNRYDKYGIQLTDKGQLCHRFHRFQPQRRNYILNSEHASEHKAEKHGEETCN